ncbi:hypothetical protein ACFFK0_10935 [Paenibacillus chartarius]|uniref:Uncharacterized protein n=1 Tax=Paenibacillus chartarius TaxID=747481 RepID=A0ABV6DJY1_9BACL
MIGTMKTRPQWVGFRCSIRVLRLAYWPWLGKVFREYMSMTPKEYRMKKVEFPHDAIYYG